MHPLDALIENHPTEQRTAPTPQPPDGQSAAAGTAVSGGGGAAGVVALVGPPPPVPYVPFPPLRDGFVEDPQPWGVWPEPCPTCQSYAWWEDARGRRHCQVCERQQFVRGLRGAHLAIRLRLRSMGISYIPGRPIGQTERERLATS